MEGKWIKDDVLEAYYDMFYYDYVFARAKETLMSLYSNHIPTINKILRALQRAFPNDYVAVLEDYQAPDFLLCINFDADYAVAVQIISRSNEFIYGTFWIVFRDDKMYLDFGDFANKEVENKVFETIKKAVRLEKVFEHRWGIRIYRVF